MMPVDGLVTVASALSPKDTMDRVEVEIAARGMTIFARVDHAGGAEAVGLPLPPTELLVFGNARGGTPLMQAVQTIGIDLPLKILVWQEADGRTWLGYNDPEWLARRHGLGSQVEATTKGDVRRVGCDRPGGDGLPRPLVSARSSITAINMVAGAVRFYSLRTDLMDAGAMIATRVAD